MDKEGLTTLTFDNYEKILELKPKDSQKEFVEDWACVKMPERIYS